MERIVGKRIFGSLLFIFLVGEGVYAREEKSPSLLFRGTRPAGMGGAYEALADDFNAFEFNPAGLASYQRFKLDLVPAQVHLTSDFVDETRQFSDVIEEVDALRRDVERDPNTIFTSGSAKALVERIRRLRTETFKMRLNAPLIVVAMPLTEVGGIRIVGGASFTNQVLTGFRFERAGLSWGSEVLDVLDDEMVVQMALDVATFRFGGAAEKNVNLPFFKTLRAGASWRIVSRRYKDDRFALIDILDPEQFKKDHLDTSVLENGEIQSLSDVTDLLEANTIKETGFGVDLGFQVRHADYLTTALVFRSIASSIGDRKFPATRTFSVAFRPFSFLGIANPLLDVVTAASLSNGAGDDFLVQFRNRQFTDHLHLGLEATLFPRSPIRLTGRVGNNHGYTTFGLDGHFLILDAGIAYYGDLDADWYTANVRLTF